MAKNNAQVDLRNFEENNPDVISNIVGSLREISELGKPKTLDELRERIQQYFALCQARGLRPGIEGLSAALHCDRVTLYYWRKGKNCSPEWSGVINEATWNHGRWSTSSLDAFISVINGVESDTTIIFVFPSIYQMSQARLSVLLCFDSNTESQGYYRTLSDPICESPESLQHAHVK